LGLQVYRLGLQVSRLGLQVSRLGLQVSRLGLQVSRLGLQVSRLGLQVSRLGLQVSRLGLRFGLNNSALGANTNMGEFNRCRSHCRLAKFRGLMIGVKDSDMIGRKTGFFVCAQHEFLSHGICLANHIAVFPPDHQTTEIFRQTTV